MPCAPPVTGACPGRQEDRAGDLAEAEGDDGEVVAAQPQDRRADEQADQAAAMMTNGSAPQNQSSGLNAGRGRRGQDRGGVRADGVEGHVAEVEQAREADHDVQAEAEQDVEADGADAPPRVAARRAGAGSGEQRRGPTYATSLVVRRRSVGIAATRSTASPRPRSPRHTMPAAVSAKTTTAPIRVRPPPA